MFITCIQFLADITDLKYNLNIFLKKGLSIELNVNLKVHLHFASKMKTKNFINKLNRLGLLKT